MLRQCHFLHSTFIWFVSFETSDTFIFPDQCSKNEAIGVNFDILHIVIICFDIINVHLEWWYSCIFICIKHILLHCNFYNLFHVFIDQIIIIFDITYSNTNSICRYKICISCTYCYNHDKKWCDTILQPWGIVVAGAFDFTFSFACIFLLFRPLYTIMRPNSNNK